MRFPCAGAADQHGIALLGEKAAAGEVADQGFVDRRVREAEVTEYRLLSKRTKQVLETDAGTA
jgi:hypothetical protein